MGMNFVFVCAGRLAKRPFCFLSVLEIGQEAFTLSVE
jgi:hypothetical protein